MVKLFCSSADSSSCCQIYLAMVLFLGTEETKHLSSQALLLKLLFLGLLFPASTEKMDGP